MTEIKNLSPARETKEPIDWNKVRTFMVVGLLAIGMAWCTTNYLYEKSSQWNSKHGFQSPVIFRSPIYDKETKKDEKVSEVMVKPVQAKEPFCYDAISCIRDVGEELKKSNTEITTMVRIAKCESGYRTDAMNKNNNGTFDRGIYQLNSIHKDISNEDAFNFEKNIRYAWNMQTKQGTTPWNSSIKCWQ